jgi:hypothetical protein
MGTYLTSSSTLLCPHGGTVVAIPSNSKISLGGDAIVLATDTFTVGGCSFAPVVPHPCVQVQWIVGAMRATADGAQPLTLESVGLCIAADGAPQGPVIIVVTQESVDGL